MEVGLQMNHSWWRGFLKDLIKSFQGVLDLTYILLLFSRRVMS
jgi:hypothetical protein